MKPILFNTDMVRPLLDGRKTVTRRVIKPQPTNPRWNVIGWAGWDDGHGYRMKQPCQEGDILYVRETWAMQQGLYWHKAGLKIDGNGRAYGVVPPEKWKPSIHMPKEAARIFLRVTNVRVERLQDISFSQVIAEGITEDDVLERDALNYEASAKWLYEKLWDSTIKPTDRAVYGWAANPWVWVISFERISREEAEGK